MTAPPPAEPTVVDVPEQGRYEIRLSGEIVGSTTYHPSDADPGVLVFPHTVVEPEHEGEGLGTALIRGALDDVRRKSARVVPVCPFVAAFLDSHPDYAELVATS